MPPLPLEINLFLLPAHQLAQLARAPFRATAGTPNRKCAQLPHILVAAGIDSRVHLMPILAQHCAHGSAGSRIS